MVILAVDVETNGLNAQKFLLGCVVDEREKEHFFNSPNKMWNWIIEYGKKQKKHGKKVYVYAHNHEFDFYSYAQNQLLNNKINYISFRPFIAIYDENIYFLDTMAFYPMSLKKVGEIIGLKKLEAPKMLLEGKFNKQKISELKPYCLRDTIIVLRAMKNIKKTMSKLGFKPRIFISAGQIAISSFLTYSTRNNNIWKFADLKVIPNERKEMRIAKSKYSNKIRESYRGGRCQAFKKGYYKKVSMYDINALYPYIMMRMRFPDLKKEIFMVKPLEAFSKENILERIGVISCTIMAPSNIGIAYLPIRYNNKTLYPKGKLMTGTWTILEIKKATQLGYKIQKVKWVLMYPELDINPFQEYMKELYNMRTKSKGHMTFVIKLIMNSLYGKFAQYRRNTDYKLIKRRELSHYLKKGYELASSTSRGYMMAKLKEPYIARYTNPLISTLITAEARNHLYGYLEQMNPKDVLYADTDSIMFKNEKKYRKMFKVKEGIGNWKIEIENKDANILKEKEYWIHDRTKMSGLMKHEQSKELIENKGKIKIKRIISMKSAIRSGKIDKIGQFEEIVFDLSKERSDNIPNHIIDIK